MSTTEWRELSRRLSTAPGWGLVAMRLFLGITFVYAGLQKISDPAFFGGIDRQGSLAMQLDSYRAASPLGPLLGVAGHMTALVGLTIIVAELAVGFGMLLGLWTRWAAIAGMALSLVLWLSVSWQVSPYFLGPDTIYLMAFTPFVMLGATDPLALDVRLRTAQRRAAGIPTIASVAVDFATVQHVCGRYDRGRCTARGGRHCSIDECPVLRGPVVKPRVEAEVSRRLLLQKAGVAAGALGATVLLGGAARALGGRGSASAAEVSAGDAGAGDAAAGAATTGAGAVTTVARAAAPAAAPVATLGHAGPASDTVAAGTLPQPKAPAGTSAPAPGTTPVTVRGSGSPKPTAAPRAAATTTSAPAAPAGAASPSGTPVAAATDVPVGATLAFVNPTTGAAAYLVQPSAGKFRAFDARCTHAGCRVRSPGGGQFACPCHGARFDTATGNVLRGPAQMPLARIKVTLGADGQLYV